MALRSWVAALAASIALWSGASPASAQFEFTGELKSVATPGCASPSSALNGAAEPSANLSSILAASCPTDVGCDAGSCGPTWMTYAGVEASFIAPLFSNTPLTINAFDQNVGATQLANDPNGASYLGFAPRLWIGVAGENGWGARGRFWQIDQYSSRIDPLNFFDPADLTGAASFSGFKAYTVDVEATYGTTWRDWDLLGSFGVRHAGVEQNESLFASVIAPTAPDLMSASAYADSQFYGTGLTFGIEGLRTICDGCYGELGLFLNGRGSVLWGENRGTIGTLATLAGPGVVAAASNGAIYDADDTMFMTEFQAGVQWSRALACVSNMRAFARVAVEYQHWSLDGNGGAIGTSFAANPGSGAIIQANSRSRDLDGLDLVGLSIATGFYW